MRRLSAVLLALLTTHSFAEGFVPSLCTGQVIRLNGVVNSRPANPFDPQDFDGCRDAAETADPLNEVVLETTLPSGETFPQCQVITGSGTAKVTGYSVLTGVPLVALTDQGPVGPISNTPFCFPTDLERGCTVFGDPDSAGLTGFTSRAVLTGSVQGRRFTGSVLTKDTGYITAGGVVGQILLIVGGDGDFYDATGTIAVAGQELGGNAFYTGYICVQPQGH